MAEALPWEGAPPQGIDPEAAWRHSTHAVYWEAMSDTPETSPPLTGGTETDLLVIGGGFTGLWAALRAKEDAPEREVVLIEAGRCGDGGSGRNGGFCLSSLTHTPENGHSRFPEEVATIERLGLENHAQLIGDVRRHGIDCDLEEVPFLFVAVDERQTAGFAEKTALLRQFGHDADQLDADQVRSLVASPLYKGAVVQHSGSATIDPLKLVRGLRKAVSEAGVRVYESTPGQSLEDRGTTISVGTPQGRVHARRAILATNAFPPLARVLKRYVVPVYDYVLASEPLSDAQLAALAWSGRHCIEDAGHRFHYYRLTPDQRILWGGYGAAYGGRYDPRMEYREDMYAQLARNFFINFPQLMDLRFEYRWAGAIDTCSRFSVFFGTALGGKVAYAAGYTGLGVGASRFGGHTALDLVDGGNSPQCALRFVRRRPVPFPPGPLRRWTIEFTMSRLAAADRNGGEAGLWLRTLDRFGLGFQS